MSSKVTTRARRSAYRSRITLVAELARYWFYRQYPGADAADVTEEEQVAMERERRRMLVEFWELDDALLHKLVEATLADCMAMTPLRNMGAKEVKA